VEKQARETSREHFLAKLGDPSFPAPIYIRLLKMEHDMSCYSLIRSRDRV
jgi:uncharacterized protein (DUF736 family)